MSEEVETTQTPDNQSGDEDVLLSGTAAVTETPSTEGTEAKEGEGKDDTTKGDEGKQTEQDAGPKGAPEKYEFKMPDGVEFDTKAFEEFEPILREANVSQETAQKLADAMLKVRTSETQRISTEVSSTINGWKEASKSDPEIGGEKLNGNLQFAARAVERFGGSDKGKSVFEFLNQSGAGNHPEVIRLLSNIGRAMAEDGHIGGKTTTAPEKDLAKRLFDYAS